MAMLADAGPYCPPVVATPVAVTAVEIAADGPALIVRTKELQPVVVHGPAGIFVMVVPSAMPAFPERIMPT